jgi:hypothetical protein
MEAPRRMASQKWLTPNQRVSGAVEEFIEGGPKKLRQRQRLFGHIIRATGERRYLVHFDNGEEKELPSNVLKVESTAASIPPDISLPAQENVRGIAMVEADANFQEAEEHEDLPVLRPEEEDAEVEEERNGGEAEENADDEEGAVNAGWPYGRMPGQLPTAANASQKDYHSIKKAAKDKTAALAGTEVSVVTRKNGTMKWTVVEGHTPPTDKIISKTGTFNGLKGFDIANFRKGEILVHMFLELSFLDWKLKVDKMNAAIEASKAKCKRFSCEEFLIGLGLIVGAAEFSQKGVDPFGGKKGEEEDDDDLEVWPSISPNPQFESYMAFSPFKDFRRFLPSIYAN